jgi:ornithine carbamoyltransferase
MTQLGGHAIYLGPSDIQMGKRESVADIAGTLTRYVDVIMARVFAHATVESLAKSSTVPVINGLSDLEHPCQILADLLTMLEHKRRLKGLAVAFVGDGENNVTHSLAIAAGMLGMDFRVANPKGFAMNRAIVTEANRFAKRSNGKIREFSNPQDAVTGADVVYTDTWVSMGDEAEKEKRLRTFRGFQVTPTLMKFSKRDAVFMHDMPAYRGNEVAASVIDGPQSIIFDQAENRLHAQKGIMVYLLREKSGRRHS